MPVLFAEEFELLALEPQGLVPLFAAAQGEGHFDEVLHDDDPAVEGNFGRLVHFLDHARELGCQGEQEVFAGDVGKSSTDGVLGKIADVFDAGAVVEPLLVGALPPLGQILRLLPLCDERSATFQKQRYRAVHCSVIYRFWKRPSMQCLTIGSVLSQLRMSFVGTLSMI